MVIEGILYQYTLSMIFIICKVKTILDILLIICYKIWKHVHSCKAKEYCINTLSRFTTHKAETIIGNYYINYMAEEKKIKIGIRYFAKIWPLIQQNCIKTGKTRVKERWTVFKEESCNTIIHTIVRKKRKKNKNEFPTIRARIVDHVLLHFVNR